MNVEMLIEENIRLGNVIGDFSKRMLDPKEKEELMEVYRKLIQIHSKRHEEIVAML